MSELEELKRAHRQELEDLKRTLREEQSKVAVKTEFNAQAELTEAIMAGRANGLSDEAIAATFDRADLDWQGKLAAIRSPRGAH